MPSNLSEQDRCPKCETKTLERDGTDLHCWGCGHTVYYAFGGGSVPPPRKQCRREGQLGAKRGHYNKVAVHVSAVIKLSNKGYGLSSITRRLGLAKNTVKAIIKDNQAPVGHEVVAGRSG